MNRTYLCTTSLIAALASITLGAAAVDCKATTAQNVATADTVLEAGAPAVQPACTLLEAFNESAVIEAICAALPDIIAIAPAVIAGVVALADVKPDAEACKPVPGSTLCFTNGQRLAVIRALAAKKGASK